MADHTLNDVRAALRSMRDVVLPAVDPDHPLAREQAGLVVKYLEFWLERMDRLEDRNRAELASYASMAAALLADAGGVSPALAELLERELARAESLLTSSGATVAELRGAVADLTRTVTALVRTANDAGHPRAGAIGRIVVERSDDVVLLQRAWFGPQGWEDPVPPPLDDVLAHILVRGSGQ